MVGTAADHIKGNIDFTENYLREHIPGIGMIRPQASYLIYLDCRGLGLTQEELVRLFVDKAHLALNDGTMFGEPGKGFMRLNIGCPFGVGAGAEATGNCGCRQMIEKLYLLYYE